MSKVFEICGIRLNFSDIKKFELVQKEYIYRPVYKEKYIEGILFLSPSYTTYSFYRMEPYAAVINEEEDYSFLEKISPLAIGSAVVSDVTKDVRNVVGDIFNIKTLKYEKYTCINVSGRKFQTYLQDIPVVLYRKDGAVMDVYPCDRAYKSLEGKSTPTIQMVPTLVITADKKYYFYGNGIMVNDAKAQYERLKYEQSEWEFNRKNKMAIDIKQVVPQLPKPSVPNVPTPKAPDEVKKTVSAVKKQISNGEKTLKKYEKKISKLIDGKK